MTRAEPHLRTGVTDPGRALQPKIHANRFRLKRLRLLIEHLERHFAGRDEIRILDVGGVRAYWQGSHDLWRHLPLHFTIVNIGAEPVDDPPYFIRGGDACDMQGYADNSFDLVHSNSVIEHVGQWREMAAMAAEIRRLAPFYYVQTPNFQFPLEPHFRTLFFHWYPEIVRARMLMRKKRGFRGPARDLGEAMRSVQDVNLLTPRQMQALFPDAQIRLERVYGLPKSIMALR